MVIASLIAKFTVERMLVESGSSADILVEGDSVSFAPQDEFSTVGGIGEACGNQKRARICYQASVPPVNKPTMQSGKKRCRQNQLEMRMVRKGEEEDNSPNKKENQKRPIPHEEDPEDKPGVDPKVAIHRLHVDSMFIDIKQRKRTFSDEKNMAIRTKVEALLKARAIRELQFLEWIANVVLVKKSNNKWRMSTDFTSLNKTCPKDYYPLHCLGRLVEEPRGMKYLISWMRPWDITRYVLLVFYWLAILLIGKTVNIDEVLEQVSKTVGCNSSLLSDIVQIFSRFC
ncbi:hypothetical protein LIER_42246 [Lithospermum erythrorhizon]|uniref:Uncharacterized protein n=1 Tax=Lithospermum erythrorhizon TaxID=34254 RepID=A0AAV3RLU9_LITER